MFERYTEKARRVVFFARYEASNFGAPCIETEHLLLGVLREDHALIHRSLTSVNWVKSIHQRLHAVTPLREKISTAVDLPLSHDSKRVLAYAAEEADKLNDRHVGIQHLLLGLLRDEKSLAATLLHELGVSLQLVREKLAAHGSESSAGDGWQSKLLLNRSTLPLAVRSRLAPRVHSGPARIQRRRSAHRKPNARTPTRRSFLLISP